MTWKQFLNSKIGLGALLAICLFAGYLLAGELAKRYQIETEINGLKQKITALQGDSEHLSGLLEYLNSSDFQEKEIRRKLNLQKPGEHVVSLPAEDAQQAMTQDFERTAVGESNWARWWKYFFVN